MSVYSDLARIDGSGQVLDPETPREILSPAVVRNGFTSFQLVVRADAKTEWWLLVGQNPENILRVTLYRESAGTLENIQLPHRSTGTEVFWMDVWTPSDAPISRIKVEPQLRINGDWVIYPMEARVMPARVPSSSTNLTPVCPLAASNSPLAKLELRNALQDAALFSQLDKSKAAKLTAFCDSPAPERFSEAYLRIRDYLFSQPALH